MFSGESKSGGLAGNPGQAKGQDGGGGTFASSKASKRGFNCNMFAAVRSALERNVRATVRGGSEIMQWKIPGNCTPKS